MKNSTDLDFELLNLSVLREILSALSGKKLTTRGTKHALRPRCPNVICITVSMSTFETANKIAPPGKIGIIF